MKNFLEWMNNKDNEVDNDEKDENLKVRMMEYLKNQYKGLEDVNSKDFLFDMEAAIYHFATDYHSGQSSELYSILSTSDYRPGMMSRGIESESETVKMLYKSLEEKFKNV
jgi:hypothetical protein